MDPLLPETLAVNGAVYRVLRLLGHGKGGYSYLAQREGDASLVVVKQIHHEPCDYYTFGNKIEAECYDYERLRAAGIRMPRMLDVDRSAERIVKEYINGPTAAERIAAGLSMEEYLPQLREMAARAKAAGLNIDYYPTNFAAQDGLLWYIDYECNAYDERWDLEHWGMPYWIPAEPAEPERIAEDCPPAAFRAYRPEDYEALCRFLIRLSRDDRSHIHWNWARLEWMIAHPDFDSGSSGSIGLWLSGADIVGAAIYDMYFGEAFCAVLPAYEALYAEVLDYAFRALRDENGLGIAICDNSAKEIAAARAAGFAPAEQGETVLRMGLTDASLRGLPQFPPGYTAAQLHPLDDLDGFQWLLWQGFDHGSDRAEFERQDPVIPRDRPHFDPALSLVALAPDGSMAAYCCLWYHPDTDYAYVEPVCTVPAHRGKGLASALLAEALRRAHALGAKEAFVISDLAFYIKLGFAEARHFTFYWKK